MKNNQSLEERATAIVNALRVGEDYYASRLYPSFINELQSNVKDGQIDVDLQALLELLDAMSQAQTMQNYTWLADLIEYHLMPALKPTPPGSQPEFK